MAQDNKGVKNKKQTNKSVKSTRSAVKVNSGTNRNSKKTANAEKVVEDVKKSLLSENVNTEKLSKKKVEINKELTTYEEQALQGATKSKGNKKLLLILLLLFVFLIIVGVAIALFFVLRPEEEAKAVVCEVEVLSYRVNRFADPEEYIVIGSGDKFNFTKETQTTGCFTKDIVETIDEIHDFAMTYLINNVSGNSYTYTLDFTDFQFKNCDVVVKVNNGETYTMSEVLKMVTISHFGDVLLEIRISGINPPVYDQNDPEGSFNDILYWNSNTCSDGNINLTLEVE